MYGWQFQDGGGWFPMVIFMIVFWALLIGGLVVAIKYFGRPRREEPSVAGPLEILRLRFARGEIDEEEFKRRRALLDETK
ncbi:MAG TPA: SHOCT domain-containing protein [Acidimicrobiales bacterium]|nr:SHOCT domain-containing protein [Acidimicrobiales bacterium]